MEDVSKGKQNLHLCSMDWGAHNDAWSGRKNQDCISGEEIVEANSSTGTPDSTSVSVKWRHFTHIGLKPHSWPTIVWIFCGETQNVILEYSRAASNEGFKSPKLQWHGHHPFGQELQRDLLIWEILIKIHEKKKKKKNVRSQASKMWNHSPGNTTIPMYHYQQILSKWQN